MASPVIYQHPLAYLLGLEGIALLRGFSGVYDEEFTLARLREVRALLDSARELGDGVVARPITPREGYALWAGTYDEPGNALIDLEQPVVREILDGLPVGVALDAACGTGRHAAYLASLGHEVIGIDESPEMLAVARERVPGGDFYVAELAKLPLADDSVDLVVCGLALMHAPDLEPVLQELVRVLRPNGHLVVSDSCGLIGDIALPLVRALPDGGFGFMPVRNRLASEYLAAALPLGLQVRRCDEIRQQGPIVGEDGTDLDGAGLNSGTRSPEHVPGSAPDIWALHPLDPAAANAAWLGKPRAIVWHFQLIPDITELGRVAAEYNQVIATFERRDESIQLMRRTAVAANESSSIEEALAVALEEICRFTGWPIGHAFLVSRDDPDLMVSTGIWRMTDQDRFAAFRAATEAEIWRAGRTLPGMAFAMRQPVIVSRQDVDGLPIDSGSLQIISIEPAEAPGEDATLATMVVPAEGMRAKRASEWLDLGLQAGLAVPIIARTRVVGVLEFFSEEPFAVDAEFLDLLLSVGTQLGRVVERQRSEEARLRALIDNMPASVYLRDLAGRFILVNREYETFWGLRDDEIRGKTIFETHPVPDVDASAESITEADREALEAGEPRRRESRVRRRGVEHVISDVRFPVLDSSGEVVAIAGIDIDITAQKHNEAELAELLRFVAMARDTAMEATSAKSRFLANMSHELRTPLNAIIGFTRIVSRHAQALPEKQVDNLSKILVSAERLLGLIDEILDLSRIEAGAIEIDWCEAGIADVVREVTDSLQPLMTRPLVSLTVETEPDMPSITTDRVKLVQILTNLLSNAIKYTDEGTITVRATIRDGRARFAVADTGLGIASDELGRIFDEFHRADSTRARSRGGTGLGLAISRRLARALGGDIRVESRLGSGSTFALELPLHPESGWPEAGPRGAAE